LIKKVKFFPSLIQHVEMLLTFIACLKLEKRKNLTIDHFKSKY